MVHSANLLTWYNWDKVAGGPFTTTSSMLRMCIPYINPLSAIINIRNFRVTRCLISSYRSVHVLQLFKGCRLFSLGERQQWWLECVQVLLLRVSMAQRVLTIEKPALNKKANQSIPGKFVFVSVLPSSLCA